MKIYVVTSGSYSDYGIEQVFLDKEKAELYVKYHDEKCWDGCRIEEYETADDYLPKDTYYKCKATFKIKTDQDFINHSEYYRTIVDDYNCAVTEKEEDYECKDYTYYHDGTLNITRYFREQDYKDREIELQDKVTKIGFDLCAVVKQMLVDGVEDDYDITKVLEGKE